MEDVDKFDEINIKFIIPADDMANYGEIMAVEVIQGQEPDRA